MRISRDLEVGAAMFFHIVLRWKIPEILNAVDRMIDGVAAFLRPIPNMQLAHVGKMISSRRCSGSIKSG
jgi:hypothetical protein